LGGFALIVLDTHVWVWWLTAPEKIPPSARRLVTQSAKEASISISSISAWEILLLAEKGRIEFSMDAQDWIIKAEALPFYRFVPVDNAIAMRSVRLPAPFHKDPADRIIVTTAIMLGATLITADRRIQRYPHVKAVWK
jgi:PIN domain nuclease of toxin-antitoxin system